MLCLVSQVSAFEAVDTLETVAELINDNYADVDKAAVCAAAVRGLDSSGPLFSETDPTVFSDAVTEFLRTTCVDRHFRLRPRPEPVIEAPNAEPLENYLASMRAAHGFRSVTRTEDNVAVIAMSRFYDTTLAQDALAGVMRVAHGADAVVMDLRGNPGGARSMVRLLASYFFTQPVQLNTFLDRSGAVTEDLWSLPEVEGPRFETQPLYIVVNSKTGSAAEAFSYHLQALDRAVVVGESTAGGANPGEVFDVGDEFTLFVSTQISRNPVTGSNWEGVGVQPDVVVESDAALDRALEMAAAKANAIYAAQRESINAAAQRAFARLKEARELRRAGDWAGYARLHEKVLEGEPALAYLWLDVGLGYHFDEDYPAAQAAYTKALEVPATRAMAMYQLACTNALLGDIDVAINWLESSLDAGFEEYSYLIHDSDLDALRGDPRFQAILATRHLQ